VSDETTRASSELARVVRRADGVVDVGLTRRAGVILDGLLRRCRPRLAPGRLLAHPTLLDVTVKPWNQSAPLSARRHLKHDERSAEADVGRRAGLSAHTVVHMTDGPAQDPTQNPEKDPADWTTGDEPMTGPQRSYLSTLAREAGEEVPDDLTKAKASEMIDRLQDKTGRGS
jgi:Protein of unknown function (DUF3072)